MYSSAAAAAAAGLAGAWPGCSCAPKHPLPLGPPGQAGSHTCTDQPAFGVHRCLRNPGRAVFVCVFVCWGVRSLGGPAGRWGPQGPAGLPGVPHKTVAKVLVESLPVMIDIPLLESR